MAFDSSTVFARTPAGDSELTLPALGLSLGQRRVLTLLQNPSAVEPLAQKYHLEPVKLERDLARLSDLRLVALRGATGVAPPAPTALPMPEPRSEPKPEPGPKSRPISATAPSPNGATMAPVVLGGNERRAPAKAFVVGTLALLVAVGIWYATRSGHATFEPVSAGVVATLSPVPNAPAPLPNAPAPVSARVANETPAVEGVATTATVLRGNAPPPERRVEIRPGLAPLVASVPAPANVQSPAPAPGPTVPVARQVPPNPEIVPSTPVAAPAAAPLAPQSPVTTAAVVPSPPVQLAAANPSPTQRPATPMPLKPISREQPEFPKEAEGVKSGTVTARLHVDARGNVSGVDILNAQPPRVFDRAVRRALLHWQFEPPATGVGADVDVDIKFQRD